MSKSLTNGITLGTTSENESLVWDMKLFPHMLIGGVSGAGKTTLLKSMLKQSIENRDKVVLLIPKKVGFDEALTAHSAASSNTLEVGKSIYESNALLTKVKSELESRYEKMQEAGSNNFLSLSEDATAIVVLIDEIIPLVRPLDPSLDPELDEANKKDNIVIKEILSALTTIARLGRAAGIHLVITTQQPASEFIPSEIKPNLDARVALGTMEESDSQVLLNAPDAASLPAKFDVGIYRSGLNLVEFKLSH